MYERNVDYKYNLLYFWNLAKRHKILLFSTLFLVMLLQGIAVAENYLFKLLVDKSTSFANDEITKSILMDGLVLIGIIFLCLALVRIVFKFLQFHLLILFENKVIYDLKEKIFSHIIRLSFNFHTSNKTGSLISKIIRGGNGVESLTDVMVFNFTPLIFKLILVGGSLLFFNKLIALIVVLTIISFIGFTIFMQKLEEKSYIIANNTEDREKAFISDIFINVDSVKLFGKQTSIIDRFRKVIAATKHAFIINWNYYRYTDSIQSLILSVGTFIIVFISIRDFVNGNMTIGSLTFVYTSYLSLMGPVFAFMGGIRRFARVMGDFETLFKYTKLKNEIEEMPYAKAMKIKKGIIEFKDVTFGYTHQHIFNNLNLKINQNEKIALVGHSGCGKSTLVKLLYRLYDINSGSILIDGKDLKSYKKEPLRNEMSIVPQECALFDDTIENNILFSKPNATKKELKNAIKFAQLDKIIDSFPNKEKTIVGERGIKLSGGEKQRVSIARALLANKKVLVLDEATSALDSQTESEIQKALKKLMDNRTSIIIAHRLSTIMHADRIIVMKRGKIIESGTHNELIKQGGYYTKLWTMQKGGYLK
jgi:ATP-binding cassette, subfamily B, heavy metal transporter